MLATIRESLLSNPGQHFTTPGFTYHADKDMWRCPEFQHLFPVFVDHAKGSVIYRVPASACNACRCKSHCTDFRSRT